MLYSILNYCLFRLIIVQILSCQCNTHKEDSFHFPFECLNHSKEMRFLIYDLHWLLYDFTLDLIMFTGGNDNLFEEQNEVIYSFFQLSVVFILQCSKYVQLRRKYNKKYYLSMPSTFKLVQLLSVENTKELCNLGRFILMAFKI